MTCKHLVRGGVHYDPGTLPEVMAYLETVKHRIRLHYGDPETGRDRLEEYMVEGRVGYTGGLCHCPIIVHNQRSLGGPIILTAKIVAIRHPAISKRHIRPMWIWRHPLHRLPVVTLGRCHHKLPDGRVLRFAVYCDGDNHANFETRDQAERWINKMGLSEMATHRPPPEHAIDQLFAEVA